MVLPSWCAARPGRARLGPLLDLAHGPRCRGRLASVRSPTRFGKDLKHDGQVGGSADDGPEQAAKPGDHRGGRDADVELAKAARNDHSSTFDRSCARPQYAATSAAE